MYKIYTVLCVCFLLANVSGQSVSLAPRFVYSSFDARSNIDGAAGYGIDLEARISESFALALLYRYIPTQQTYSTPTGTDNMQINMHLLGLQFSTPLIKFNSKSGTSIIAGIGSSTFRTAARLIDLGAIGARMLSAESASYFTYWAGVSGYYYIFPFITVHFEPQVTMINTTDGNYTNYLLAGGVAIEL